MPEKAEMSDIKIGGTRILPGEEAQVNLLISKLPTRIPIEMPVFVARAKKPGPTLLMMGGIHGDEINGVEIVRRIIKNRLYVPTIGTVICIPVVNIFGFLNLSREVPDGKDVNRSFPGSKTGSLASLIAYQLRTTILNQIDFGIDFHTGGSRINNFPQIRTDLSNPLNREIGLAFGTKFLINSPLREKSLRKYADKLGKPIVVYEAGESLRLRKKAIDEGINGAMRVMKHFGMKDEGPQPSHETVIIEKSIWVRAKAGGMYHSYVRPGESVVNQDILGLITGPYGDFETKIKCPESGHIISVNNLPLVNKGDALMHLGIEK